MEDRIIVVDTAQQDGKHERKHRDLRERGFKLILAPLPVGDYIFATERVIDALRRKETRKTAIKKMDLLGTYNVTVDTKRDMQEVYSNVVGKQHDRFRDECILAQNNNIRLVVLIENTDGINEVRDVANWKNPRYTRWHQINGMHEVGKMMSVEITNKPPVNSVQLMKSMLTMQLKYGVEFQFCKPTETGQRIAEIVEGGESCET